MAASTRPFRVRSVPQIPPSKNSADAAHSHDPPQLLVLLLALGCWRAMSALRDVVLMLTGLASSPHLLLKASFVAAAMPLLPRSPA